MAKRVYNRQEISSILAKASELEVSRKGADYSEGLSKDELMKLAAEVGVSIKSMEDAIQSLKTPAFSHSYNWISGTARLENIQQLDTRFTPEFKAAALQHLQESENEIGNTDLKSGMLVWKSQKEMRFTSLKFVEEDNKVRVEYSSNWMPLKIISSVFPAMVLFILTVALTKEMGLAIPVSLLAGLGGAFVGVMGARVWLKFYFNNQKNRMINMLNKLQGLKHKTASGSITIEEYSYSDIEKEVAKQSKDRA